jgi:hypothetical protein
MMKKLYSLALLAMTALPLFAGNPDRQGEAGAYELLLNPWARSAGLHAMNVSIVRGVDGLYLNPAGIAPAGAGRIEAGVSQSRYLSNTGIKINAFGFVSKVGETGVMGVNINSMDFGQIPITTANQPEGTGGTYSPAFINIGLSYARVFEKVTVGLTFRVISEAINDLRATGACLDAGVQYNNDKFHFGLSLRNIGSRMRFGGEGLSFSQSNPDQTLNYNLTYNQRSASFEMPSQLNIGVGYDVPIGTKAKAVIVGNFTSNSFSRDEVGGGAELVLFDGFTLRGGYRAVMGQAAKGYDINDAYTGLCGGASVDFALKKGSPNKLGFDYSYLPSNPFNGTHNIAFRINM